MICQTCQLVISDKSYALHSGNYYHAGSGKWDADSCYNVMRIEEMSRNEVKHHLSGFSLDEAGMGVK